MRMLAADGDLVADTNNPPSPQEDEGPPTPKAGGSYVQPIAYLTLGAAVIGLIWWANKKGADGLQDMMLRSGEYELKGLEDCGCNLSDIQK